MSISRIFKAVKAKGVKFNFIKIPTRRTPRVIEHSIRNEFDRERTYSLLEEVAQLLSTIELNPEALDISRLRNLRIKVCAFKKELHEYKC